MSRLSSLFARLMQSIFVVQLTLLEMRERFIQWLCAMALTILPGSAFAAGGDIADMFDAAAEGAKRGQTSTLTMAQFGGVLIFIAALLAFKKINTNPQVTLGRCIGGLIIGALLVVVPELLSRSQKQMGMSATTIS